jgi:inorganic triphosphatase YgiF
MSGIDREVELKLELNEDVYHQLLQKWGSALSTVKQDNYFFDTPDRTLLTPGGYLGSR